MDALNIPSNERHKSARPARRGRALPSICVAVSDQQTVLPLSRRRLAAAVRRVLVEASIRQATVSLAVVDDPTIHRLNRQFLGHDEPTDVLSFLLDRGDDHLEAEIVVSAQTAAAAAGQFGWSAQEELLLYVIHGALHLVGCDDRTSHQRAKMRSRERAHLERWGVRVPHVEKVPFPGGKSLGGKGSAVP
jgi:probable rRNA maturation factor